MFCDKLTDEQAEVYEFARNGHNILVTGRAGTGKSTVTTAIRNHFRQRGLQRKLPSWDMLCLPTDPEKIKVLKTWPVPLNVEELQIFLGLASYYRKFILAFSIIAVPLYQLCRKNVSFSWQQEQQSAFKELKDRLVSVPLLAYPNFGAEAGSFILDTDASQYQGIGAVLSQHQPDGTERVIAYGSRSLTEHENNYSTIRLKMLVLVTYVDYFRYYLLWRRFRIGRSEIQKGTGASFKF